MIITKGHCISCNGKLKNNTLKSRKGKKVLKCEDCHIEEITYSGDSKVDWALYHETEPLKDFTENDYR